MFLYLFIYSTEIFTILKEAAESLVWFLFEGDFFFKNIINRHNKKWELRKVLIRKNI